jgi:Xaa-Pro aminopeptidase
MLEYRIDRLRAIMHREELNAVVFFNPVNIRYFCGFTGTDGVLLVTRDKTVFLTDSRYTAQAEAQVVANVKKQYTLKVDGLVDELVACAVSRVGIEADFVTVALHQKLLDKHSSFSLVALDDPLREVRQVKDDAEISCLEKAAQLNKQAFESVLPMIKPGVSEQQIALELECFLRRAGGEDKAFELIVASGQRGALPHGVASDKKIATGELVTIDFGTRFCGYHSDETVTVAVGDVSTELRNIYDVVLEAHDRALAALSPSGKAREIDAVARQYIEQMGYGEYFGHGLGHGVGLEIHEAPTISPRSEAFLTAGMVFTIEPGIYIPGVGGVRIEDTVVMTVDGYRCLTQIPKTFRQVA